MRRALPIALLALTGCMSRPGVIDCTTGRAYPGFSKPLCGGPFDPFVWLAGDCQTCCAGCLECAYTPYGGLTHHGEDMYYTPSCVAPPLKWAPPALPEAPGGHAVYCPPSTSATPVPDHPVVPIVPPSPPAPAVEDQAERAEISSNPRGEAGGSLLDARYARPGQSLR